MTKFAKVAVILALFGVALAKAVLVLFGHSGYSPKVVIVGFVVLLPILLLLLMPGSLRIYVKFGQSWVVIFRESPWREILPLLFSAIKTGLLGPPKKPPRKAGGSESKLRRSREGGARQKRVPRRGGDAETRGTIRAETAAARTDAKVAPRPKKLEDVQPLLRAVEALLAVGDVDGAKQVFFTQFSDECPYTLDEWLWHFGYLDEEIRINSLFIEAYVRIVKKEGTDARE